MRTKIIIAVITALFTGSGLFAQVHDHSKSTEREKVDTIAVSGKCGMCKTNIETAARIKGVNQATWDSEKQSLVLVYNPSVANVDEVQKKIAAVGYDTEKYRADDKAYDKLHGCCKYERKK